MSCSGRIKRVKINGQPIVKGKTGNGLLQHRGEAVHLTKIVPFLGEDELKRLGGQYEKVSNCQSFVIVDGHLITGQNPASSRAAAQELIKLIS